MGSESFGAAVTDGTVGTLASFVVGFVVAVLVGLVSLGCIGWFGAFAFYFVVAYWVDLG